MFAIGKQSGHVNTHIYQLASNEWKCFCKSKIHEHTSPELVKRQCRMLDHGLVSPEICIHEAQYPKKHGLGFTLGESEYQRWASKNASSYHFVDDEGCYVPSVEDLMDGPIVIIRIRVAITGSAISIDG